MGLMNARRLTLMVPVILIVLIVSLLFSSVPAFARTGYAATPLASFAPPGGFNGPAGLAVDDSMSSSRGDVYVTDGGNSVVDEFSPGGTLLAQASVPGAMLNQLTVDDYAGVFEGYVYVAGGNGVIYRFTPGLGTREELITELSTPTDVSVDEAGYVFVQEGIGDVLEFNSAGKPVNANGTVVGAGVNKVIEGVSEPSGIAVNADGSDLYTATGHGAIKYTLSGGVYAVSDGAFDTEGSTSVIVAPEGDVDVISRFHGERYQIAIYEPSGTLVTATGDGTLSFDSYGLGINEESGDLYVADQQNNQVFVFEAGEMPETPKTEPYSDLNGSSVVLNGTLTAGVASYHFDYNEGSSCEGGQTTATVDVSGAGPVNVEVGDLSPFSHYSFCLVATNKYGSVVGSTLSFETGAVQPQVSGESASVGIASATVGAQVNPRGALTTYYVEYGLGIPYESKTAVLGVGSGEGPIAVSVELTGLISGAQYHFQIVAVNESGSTRGGDAMFTTYPLGISGLPDGRMYEMVTSPDNPYNSEVYEVGSGLIYTEEPFQASVDGNAVAYVGLPSTGGTGSSGIPLGNEYRATWSPQDGWSSVNITPPSGTAFAAYAGFSSDLSVGFINEVAEPPFKPTEVLGNGTEAYEMLYGIAFGEGLYRPFFTRMPPNRSWSYLTPPHFYVGYAGASADSSHLLFSSNDDLLEGEGSLERELSSDVKQEQEKAIEAGSSEPEDERSELYVSVGGRVSLINVLPDDVAAPNATFGGNGPDFSHDISDEGSRIFWTDLNTGILYVRENASGVDAKTVAVSEKSAKFQTASGDGRYVFYMEAGKLYRFDVESETREELAGSENGVQGVIGVNETGEDGAYVYFVASEVLTGEESAEKLKAVSGEENLYVSELDPQSAGQYATRFIGVLSESDSNDWQPNLGERTAELTPDGRAVVFASTVNLTDRSYADEGSEEVYVYRAESARLFCASCRAQASGGHLASSGSAVYMHRWISEDGDHVFFESEAPLVARDVNGVRDVYEWEPDGTGECQEVEGCVYLLSDGLENAAFFVDASANGDNVFIATRQRLLPEDQNEFVDLYDARVGGLLPVSPPQCTGTGCQGAPAPPPVFATPASVTFAGVGNFPPPTAPAEAPRAKSLTRAQKLSRALDECHKKRNGKRRLVCESRARKSYGVKTRAKAKVKRSVKKGAK